MSILFLVLCYGNINAQNGGAKFIRLLSEDENYWKENGVECKVYSNSTAFTNETQYRKSNIYKIKVGIKSILNKFKIGRRYMMVGHNKRLGISVLNRSEKDIKNASWILLNDIIVASEFFRKYGNTKKTIFMMHNNGDLLSMMEDLFDDRCIKKYLKDSEQEIFKCATKIIFVSKTAMRLFRDKYPEYQDKVDYIYNGLEKYEHQEKITREYKDIKLVSVGTICKRKNQIAQIKALKKLEDKNIQLTLVGDGPDLNECKSLAEKYGLSSKIDFVGAQNNVIPYLRAANVYISTSLDEGLPISAQEAMREGLPLILTDVGGCSELIDHNGLLIDTNLNSIVNALREMSSNTELLKEMGERSYYIFSSKFVLPVMKNRYLSMLQAK